MTTILKGAAEVTGPLPRRGKRNLGSHRDTADDQSKKKKKKIGVKCSRKDLITAIGTAGTVTSHRPTSCYTY